MNINNLLKDKKAISKAINDFLEKESLKTNEEIQKDIEFKNSHPELFQGSICEQLLKRRKFENEQI